MGCHCPARGAGTLIPSAQRLVWAAKQPLGNAALGALVSCVGISGKHDGGHHWRPKACKVGRENILGVPAGHALWAGVSCLGHEEATAKARVRLTGLCIIHDN